MDLRRPLRSSSGGGGGVEPKIRQIGFFTQTPSLRAPPSRGHGPGAVNELGGDSGVAAGAGRPPLHHADHLPPGLPSPAMIDAVLATSAPVRSSARLPSQSCRLMRKGETTHNIIQLRKQAECWRICRNCWRLHAGGGLLMCWLAQVMKQKNKVNLQLSLLFGLQAQHIWTPSNYALMMTEWIKESGEQLAMLSGFSVA